MPGKLCSMYRAKRACKMQTRMAHKRCRHELYANVCVYVVGGTVRDGWRENGTHTQAYTHGGIVLHEQWCQFDKSWLIRERDEIRVCESEHVWCDVQSPPLTSLSEAAAALSYVPLLSVSILYNVMNSLRSSHCFAVIIIVKIASIISQSNNAYYTNE